jgi:aminoglycoside phosphotransferase (APT) family kinase protein
MADSGLTPSDRQLLLAVRSAVAAARTREFGDGNDMAASLASAETALGVLLTRADVTGAGGVAMSTGLDASVIAREASDAAACLAPPAEVHQEADVDMTLLVDDLAAHLSGTGDTRIISLTRLAGGFSRETIALQAAKGEDIHSLILRRQRPRGLLEEAGLTVLQEYPVIRHLHNAGVPVAEPLWVDPRGRVFGEPYMVMRRVGGTVLGTPVGGTGVTEEHLQALAQVLARLHTLPWESQAASLLPAFGLRIAPASQAAATADDLDRWGRYRAAHDLELSPALLEVEQWLRRNIPRDETTPCLLHGDVGFHNILFDGGHITALLDWEMAHLGSPAKDLSQVYAMVSAIVDWDLFMRWYTEAGGPHVPVPRLAYFKVFSGYTYLLVCEMARQAMLARPEPDVAYVDLAFPVRAHFYAELSRAIAEALSVSSPTDNADLRQDVRSRN